MNNIEIKCKDLSKSYSGKVIFKNLSFNISTKQSLVITGRNGSGKSTLVKLIANLIHSSGGNLSIEVNGKESERDTWFQRTGLVSPYLNLYDELTGFENLEFFLRLGSANNENFEERINDLLQKVSLYEKRNEPVKNYSSGMKQRLKLAFAVSKEPEILLLDEPGTNLDKEGIELFHKISREQKERGILLIATNDENDKQLCDDVLNIEDYK